MTQGVLRTTVAALTAFLVLAPATTSAHHRPNKVVLVGGAISQTGRFAEPAGRQVNAIKMWVEEVSARGGLLDHKINLVLLDDKSDTQTAVKLYEKLITEDKVDLLLAPYSSAITEAVANINERYKMPFVAYGASARPIWTKGRKYIFNIVPVAEDYQKGSLHLAKKIGVTKIAIIGEDTLFPRQSGVGAKEWADKLGLQVVLQENYTQRQTDFTALLQKCKATGAEAIISNSYFADAAAQVRQLRELNLNFKMFSGTVGPSLPNFAKQLGDTAEYVFGFSSWEPLPDVLKHPGMKEFVAEYEKRFGEMPNYHAGSTFGALQVTEAAVKKAGTSTARSCATPSRRSNVTTVFSRYKVDGTGMNQTDGLTFQILKGERRIVYPEELAEMPAKLPIPQWSER